MVFGGKLADHRSMKKIPASDVTLFKQCQKEGGFVPYYIRKMRHQTAKKALSFGFLLRLCQGSEEVPVQLKQVRYFLRHRTVPYDHEAGMTPHRTIMSRYIPQSLSRYFSRYRTVQS